MQIGNDFTNRRGIQKQHKRAVPSCRNLIFCNLVFCNSQLTLFPQQEGKGFMKLGPGQVRKKTL